MSPAPLYRLRDVQKALSATFTLVVPELGILPGETLCLLGPTGAGKSTLLRLLAGLEPPTSGEVRFEEGSLSADQMPVALRRRITMVHQRPLLLSGSVEANVEYGLRVRGIRQRHPRVKAVLQRVGLERLASQSASTLSGGQVQLVAVARALVVEPDVLLLDEPTAHLDPAHVELVEGAVRAARQGRAMTVVWATHNLFQAKRVADRVGLLLSGQLVEIAPVKAFFESPTDTRTADFVQGRMVY